MIVAVAVVVHAMQCNAVAARQTDRMQHTTHIRQRPTAAPATTEFGGGGDMDGVVVRVVSREWSGGSDKRAGGDTNCSLASTNGRTDGRTNGDK